MIRRTPIVLIICAFAAAASAQTPEQIQRGQKVYAAEKCSICHAIGGTGNKKGPLDGVGTKLTADEIRQWIVDAPAMAAKTKADRKPPMKAYTAIAKDDLDAIVVYLASLKK